MKMRKSLWIVAFVFVAIVAPIAHADDFTNYTVSFTGSGTLPTSPTTVTFDDTTNQFTLFTVTWDGLAFDFASELSSAANENIDGVAACGGSTKAASFLLSVTVPACLADYTPGWDATFSGAVGLMDLETSATSDVLLVSTSNSPTTGAGTFTFALVPEPPSIVLLGTGLLALGGSLAFAGRKRKTSWLGV
jgi:hypothetical protein